MADAAEQADDAADDKEEGEHSGACYSGGSDAELSEGMQSATGHVAIEWQLLMLLLLNLLEHVA